MLVKDWLPSIVTIIVFLLGFWRQNWLRKRDKKNELENLLIHTADKMLRFTISYEQRALELRRHEEMIKLTRGEEKDLSVSQFGIFQKQMDDLGHEYDLLRAELTKNVRDILKYIPDNKKLIIELLERIAFIGLRQFTNDFYNKFDNQDNLHKAFEKKSKILLNEILFDRIGYHLIYLQRLIDQHSPMLYVRSEEDVKKLNDRLSNYEKYAAEHDKNFHQ